MRSWATTSGTKDDEIEELHPSVRAFFGRTSRRIEIPASATLASESLPRRPVIWVIAGVVIVEAHEHVVDVLGAGERYGSLAPAGSEHQRDARPRIRAVVDSEILTIDADDLRRVVVHAPRLHARLARAPSRPTLDHLSYLDGTRRSS